jgi:hypothetical protein
MNLKAFGAALAGVLAVLVGSAPAQAESPHCPPGYTSEDTGCIARLTAVSADSTAGTLTGTPIGSTTPVTVFGEPGLYRPSTGFGSASPDLVQQWDAVIARGGSMSPDDPDWYGEGKATAFLPRQLNDIAARLPTGTIVVRGVPDAADTHIFILQSIQPVA